MLVSSICTQSESVKNSLAEQRKSGSAISHPFDQLELIHFSLNQAVVLRESQTCYNGCFVPLDPLDKTLEFAYLAGSTFRQPGIKLLTLPMMKEAPKFLDELIGCSRCFAGLTNGRERFLFLFIKGVGARANNQTASCAEKSCKGA